MIICCPLRAKILLQPLCLTEEACGVADSEMVDVMTFEKSTNGRPVITFKFCPWCGKKWELSGRIVEKPVGPNGA